jgi:biotin carboxylase
MQKLAVIGANEPLLPYYKQAKAMGYHLIGIAWAEGAVCKQYCDKFYPISFQDKEEVLKVCREEKIDGITSFSLESALPTVVYVAQAMGLVGNTEECVKRTETKFAQRNAFEENGIPVPRYVSIDDEAQLNSVDLHYPIIVKPLDSGGSQGINKLEDKAGLLNAYNIAAERSRTNRVIIEEFIDGREFSVEALSCKGKHYILQITDKVTSGAPHFIEIQHHQPADIPSEVAARIREMVSIALTALKIENSPSHTEIKLNTRGELYIIEIGARLGGDYITSDLVRLSTGYDMVKGTIELALGDFKEPVLTKSMHSGVYFYSKLAPEVGDIIKHHEKYPEIVEWEYSDEPLMEVKSNADRRGYFLYQKETGRFNQ